MQQKLAKLRDSFTALEAAKIALVPYQTVDYWGRTGFIMPSISAANGRGSARRYSFDDLIALRVARELRKAGASMQALRRVVAALRSESASFADSRLIVVGTDVELVSSQNRVMSLLKAPGQLAFPAFICDGPTTVKTIQKRIIALKLYAAA